MEDPYGRSESSYDRSRCVESLRRRQLVRRSIPVGCYRRVPAGSIPVWWIGQSGRNNRNRKRRRWAREESAGSAGYLGCGR